MTEQEGSRPASLMSERRVSIIGAVLATLGPVSLSLFTPAMPEIVHAFDTTPAAVKMTLSLYFAGFAFAQLICGPLSDGFGRKPVTFAFLVLYLAASVMALLAPNIEVLIAARFLQGFGAAVGVAVSRAVVRDLFTGETSARVMNLIGMILAVGPAMAPTLGGLMMEAAGWHAIFLLMVGMGLGTIVLVHVSMAETVVRDTSRIRPGALFGSYATLLTTPYFVLCGVMLGGAVGALYTQATVLPFILMEKVGLTATQFGVSMLMQTGSYFAGSVATRLLIGRVGAVRLIPVGLGCIALGNLLLAMLLASAPPSLLSVMGPIGLAAFGIAFIVPGLTTASLAAFPRIAGAASAMGGFFQMGGGMLGGSVCALFGEPVAALAIVVPAMGFAALVSWFVWQRLPEPAIRA